MSRTGIAANAVWPSWAKVGAKVVCINNALSGWLPSDVSVPPRGTPLVIRSLIGHLTHPLYANERRGLHVEISGYPNFDARGAGELGWRLSRFRPLVTKTEQEDIEAFKTLLDDIPSDTKLKVLEELLNQ